MFVSEKTSPWLYLVFHFTDITIQLFAFEQYFGVHELNLYFFFSCGQSCIIDIFQKRNQKRKLTLMKHFVHFLFLCKKITLKSSSFVSYLPIYLFCYIHFLFTILKFWCYVHSHLII